MHLRGKGCVTNGWGLCLEACFCNLKTNENCFLTVSYDGHLLVGSCKSCAFALLSLSDFRLYN